MTLTGPAMALAAISGPQDIPNPASPQKLEPKPEPEMTPASEPEPAL